MAFAARALADPPSEAYRTAPQNVEAEQALLGAILVNNEAFYRVSDFLEPQHFFEPVHRVIYEVAGQLIRTNKIATPVTIKTFLPSDLAIGDITSRPTSRGSPPKPPPSSCRGLRPLGLRPRHPPRSYRHRRGHGQRCLRRHGRGDAAEPDRRCGEAPLRPRREGQLRFRLPRVRAGAAHGDRHGVERLQA